MAEIVSTRVIEPRGVSSFPIAFGIIFVLQVAVAIMAGGSAGAFVLVFTLGSLVGLMLLLPISMAVNRMRSTTIRKELADAARLEMVRLIGREPVVIDTYGSLSAVAKGAKISASGIAWDGAKIWVMDDGVVGAIPPGMIRTWEWKTQGASQVKLYGNVNEGVKQQVALENMVASAKAFMDCGFFFRVSDLKKPLWQFAVPVRVSRGRLVLA